jgi:hypothetical protein
MGTQLSIVGKHTFSEEFTKEKIVSLAYNIADYFIQKFNLTGTERGLDNFEIQLNMDFKNPCLHFYIDGIGNGIWLYVYENAFIMNSYHKFHHFVYDAKAGTDKDAGFFKDFRNEIFDMIQIMNCNRVIYLCDEGSGREQAKYTNKLMEGTSFDEVEQELIKRYGEPITDLDKIKSDGDPYTFYDRLNEFIVDDFKDFL